MTDTAGIHFGPAWLRNTFVQPPQGADHSAGGPGGGPGTGPGNPNKSPANLNIMAPAKLAEFRYGREEMLALFEIPAGFLPPEQNKVIARADLWPSAQELEANGNGKGRFPLNLMGPMSEEEQRAWSSGANSATSMRLYKKEIIPSGGSMTDRGGPGVGRGGHGERGRGRGRGFFDRHRGPPDDEDGVGRREEGGRPFGRGMILSSFAISRMFVLFYQSLLDTCKQKNVSPDHNSFAHLDIETFGNAIFNLFFDA